MRPPKIFKNLTPLVIAAILLSLLAAPASEAQRRRTRTRAAQRARRNTPRATPARAQAPTTPAVGVTQPAASGAQPSNSNDATAPRSSDATNVTNATGADAARGPQDERTFEEMIGADTYGAYVELRRVGTLAQANELKTALAGLKLFGDVETKPVTDLIEFVSSNHETLAEARFVMLFMAARPRVPLAVSAVEFPTAQDAAAFEPKYRQFADEQLKAFKAKYNEPKPSPDRRASRRGGRAQVTPEAKVTPTPFDYTLRRVGRVLISGEKGLSLKRLRGEESAPSLADSSRFQNARTRFSSDSLFVYVDTGVTMQGYARLGQEAAAGRVDTTPGRVGAESVGVAGESEVAVVAPTTTTLEVATAPVESATPEPEELEGDERAELTEEERKALDAELAAEAEANKPSEEQRAVSGMGSVMRSLWGGMPRIPGAFALGVRLDNGAVVLRLAVENSNDGKVSIIPFLPNFVAGPPVTAAAAEVAPADADIFVTTSLDWEQVYVSTLGSASLSPTLMTAGALSDGDDPTENPDVVKPPKPEEAVAAIEKLFGFKFKEDLIPSLGNEVAFSMPFDSNDLGLGPSRRRSPKKEDEKEKESEAGPVVIVSLNDPDKIRKILPRVLAALGFVPLGGQPSQAERREGFEINSAGGFVYSVIDRFLVLGADVKAVRHVVDSYAARRTLASTNSYRDATGWQAPQKIVQAYVSEALMRSTVEETKRRSGESTDPLVRTLLAQLEAPPEPASLETTNEGDAVIHELRVPVSMIQTYALAIAVSVRDAPVISGESSATYALYEVHNAEMSYKVEKKKERYGTLEELVAEKILDKGFAEHLDYRIELNASGEKFDVTATPKEYGKSGRLSFFLDETGTMRAADHKGRPATASDPPVD